MATIKKLTSGRWRVDFRVGNFRRRISFGTRREAEEYHRQLLLRPLDQTLGVASLKPGIIADVVDSYLEGTSKLKSPETHILEKRIFSEFKDAFGSTSVLDVTQMDLEAFQAKLRRRLSAVAVNRYFNAIRHFFQKCIDWQYLAKSPCDRLKNLRNDHQRAPRVYSESEVQMILAEARPWVAAIIRFILLTGARRKEVVCLRWRSVNFERRSITIEAYEDFHPKGYRPRPLPMSTELHDLLQSVRSEAIKHGKWGSENRVFLSSEHNKIHPNQLTTEFRRMNAKLKLDKLNPHALRHTALTNLAISGVNSAAIQQVAGHADIRTTQRYIHLASHDLKAPMERLSVPKLKVVN